MKTTIVPEITDTQRLEIYDRLASKWAQKMEARMARRRAIHLKHPNLVISFKRHDRTNDTILSSLQSR